MKIFLGCGCALLLLTFFGVPAVSEGIEAVITQGEMKVWKVPNLSVPVVTFPDMPSVKDENREYRFIGRADIESSLALGLRPQHRWILPLTNLDALQVETPQQ